MNITENIEKFVDNCANFDELPHCFDDTLLDKLVESVKFDEPTTVLVEKLINQIDFEGRCVPIQITIRLLESAIRHGAFKNDEKLLELINDSEQLLIQKRPAKLFDDLFNFYSNQTVFEVRKADLWLNVFHWSLNEIDEPATSIFVRRKLQKFICHLNSGDARRLMIISGVLQIFDRRIGSMQIIDAVIKILETYASELVPEECINIVDTIRNSSHKLGFSTIKLLVNLQKTHPGLIIPYTPDKWKNESNRVDSIVNLLEDPAVANEEQAQMVELVTVSPAFRIVHQIMIIRHMTDAQIDEFLHNLEIRANDRRLVRITDLAMLIPLLKGKVSSERIFRFLDFLGERILESCSVFIALRETYGQQILDGRESIRKLINSGINSSDSQLIDTCLEVAWMFPTFLPSHEQTLKIMTNSRLEPYVVTSCLLILRDYYGGIPMDMATCIVLRSVDPAPRLITMKWLNQTDEEIANPTELVDCCLQDLDMELREEAMKMAKKHFGQKHQKMEAVLREWVDDKYIGAQCREIIGLPPAENPDEAVLIIEEMLSALRVKPNEDDTMDCY